MTEEGDEAFACLQWVGKRELQEDAITAQYNPGDASGLFVVCDGMGGHNAGEVASALGSKSFFNTFNASSGSDDVPGRLMGALKAADRSIRRAIDKDGSLKGMGTTLSAAYVTGNTLYWISVGDSHIYLVRDGAIKKVNADHSMWPLLLKSVEAGDMTMEEAARDPRRNQLRSALIGECDLSLVDITKEAKFLRPGDRLILATDGLDVLKQSEICTVITEAGGAEMAIAKQLIGEARDRGVESQDNLSVIVFTQPPESLHADSTEKFMATEAETKTTGHHSSLWSRIWRGG